MGFMILTSDINVGGLIIAILFAIFCFLSPWIVFKLTKPKIVKEQSKMKKKCTAKTKARVTDMHGTMPVEFRGDPDAWSGGDRTIASYEFFINGIRYTGRDEIFTSLAVIVQTIDVLYDPSDPSNNCTPYGRRANNGTHYIIPLLIVVGVIAFIVLFFVLVARFLNSF